MNFKKIIFLLIFGLALFGCQDVKKGFSKTKIDKGEEFLIKKKNPLETPPNFDEMPKPGEIADGSKDISISDETLFQTNSDSNENLTESGDYKNSTLEDEILKKIK